MLPYLAAAVILLLALGALRLANSHRTILDPGVEIEMVERLDRLRSNSRARWGRMSVGQMLRHVSLALEMSTGRNVMALKRTPLCLPPLKQLVLGVIPFPKGAPTAPGLIVREDIAFESEQTRVRDQIRAVRAVQLPSWPSHPIFGALTREEWGGLIWKHLDHHLRQFGV